MAKIDLEKVLIALLDSPFNKQFDDKVKDALKEQGLEYKDGEIVEVQKLKYKVGDWIIRKNKALCPKSYLIIGINPAKTCYMCEDLHGIAHTFPVNAVETGCALWNINDAEPGDVLACNTNIFIYQKLDKYDIVKSFCDYHKQYGFNGLKDSVANKNECKLANKEQRDFLFQKMKEAGYEWDAEKKELKKIYKPLYEAGNIIIYKGYTYGIKEVVKDEERGFYYNLVPTDGGKVSSIGPAGEKDITLLWKHVNIQQKDFAPIETVTEVIDNKHWQDVRERAAIAALGGLMADSVFGDTPLDTAKIAIDYADALVEQLKKKM